MKTTILLILVALALSGAAFAQQPVIEHSALSCMRAGEATVIQARVSQPGELRLYFRRVGATDWCYVVATNNGPLSSAVLPAFENGTEIEYFFVLLKGKQVIGRSPQVYRAKATERCDALIARHNIIIATECAPNSAASIPAGAGAGFAVKTTSDQPATPFQPGQQ